MDFEVIGARFAQERERLGYTASSFARLLNVTRVTLANVESGKNEFKSGVLVAAAAAGMDVQYVLTGVRSTNVEKVADEVGFEKQVIQGNVSGVGFAGAGANISIVNTQTHRTTVRPETKPGEEHISIEQRAVLTELVNKVVEKEELLKKAPKSYRAVWAALNKHCKVNSYQLIAAADFEKARSYLNQWIGSLHGMRSAPLKDGEDWRKRKIQAIWANTKTPDDEAALRAYALKNFGSESIKELANDELERTYKYVASRRSRKR
ncbi:helix-turn-helix domain-containing protein [Agrobacterium sp. MS2]|uniref:helix-turn-helix domain-containing protein n=1 Tax=Agrobacterium sp. MS2 TaxID=1345498 RepID=UPI0018789133|nr:helix-turn-helix domain-containing protein [Agrobacterium sp. MS2]